MGALRPWHIAIFVAVLVLLFGAKRLPDAARSLGRSLRIIKAETRGLIDDTDNLAESAEQDHSRRPLHADGQQGQATYQSGGRQSAPQQPPAQPYRDPVPRVNSN